MSGSTVKAERRELRRAFGGAACDAITAHGRALERLANLHGSLQREHDLFQQQTKSALAKLQAQQAASHIHETRPFWQRLRWLLIGR